MSGGLLHHVSERVERSTSYPPGSVGSYLLEWLDGRRSLRPSTQVAYTVHLQRHLLPHLGDIPLTRLAVDDIERMYRLLLDEKQPRVLSNATVRRIHATLTNALNHAVRRGVIPANPATLVELPRAERPEMAVWAEEQLAVFLRAAQSHRLGGLFTLVAYTGLRRGEAVGLRWRDVNLDAGTLGVEQQLVWVSGRTVLGPPKTRSGRRTVALAQPVVDALRANRARQAVERIDAGDRWIDTDLVFTGPLGGPLDPAAVSRAFNTLTVHTGLPRIRFHDLRHTSASIGLASGESLLEVSRRLGHSSITITADVYAHVAPTTARTAAERLARHVLSTQSDMQESGRGER